MFDGYELKRLDRDGLYTVYQEHLTDAFPSEERKPFGAMVKLMEAGRYVPLGFYCEDILQAYAMLWHDPDGDFLLLDYLALCHGATYGTGLGTALLERLKAQCSGRGILVEAEALKPGLSQKERATRKRRLEFYHRSGFRSLGYNARIFDVEYAMLFWGEASEVEIMEAHERLYHYEFTPWLYQKFIQIPVREFD